MQKSVTKVLNSYFITTGENDTAPLISEFCCDDPANLPTFITTGDTAYVLFTTDATNNYNGFKIQYVSDGPTTTTSTSTTSTTSTTTTASPTTSTQPPAAVTESKITVTVLYTHCRFLLSNFLLSNSFNINTMYDKQCR